MTIAVFLSAGTTRMTCSDCCTYLASEPNHAINSYDSECNRCENEVGGWPDNYCQFCADESMICQVCGLFSPELYFEDDK